MSKILIPLAISRSSKDTLVPNHFVRETYLYKLFAYKLTPILLPVHSPREIVDALYEECCGVLFTGGGDIDPVRYGQTPHPKTEVDDPRRDEFEISILQRAMKDKKPFLGICRGCQVLAVASGGSLYQHVPDIVSTEFHGVSEGGTYDELLQNSSGHKILIDEDSSAHRIIGRKEIATNSGHHQSVKETGKNIRVSGRSPAGIIEIIEHTDPQYFCFGIQSHPECCGTGLPQARGPNGMDAFFEKFGQATEKFDRS